MATRKKATPLQQFASTYACSCGKLAKYKAIVSIYPLGMTPRTLKTARAIPICETCFQPVAKKVNVRTQQALASAFAEASDKLSQVALTPNRAMR